ncbi:MAG TPA: MerC domain-containing protein [Chitinophagaceae bacterium]|jgi:hypothetical protein
METNDVVRKNTSPDINQRVDIEIREHLNQYYNDPSKIDRRLCELDHEWDIERVFQLNAAALSLMGLWRGITTHRVWFILPAAVAGFLALNATEGWCPPITLLRRLGFRTRQEIEKEKYALKTIRGDFKYLLDVPNLAWNAVNK